MIPAIFVALSIDYPKLIKAKSNVNYYLCAFLIGASMTFLVGEFFFKVITMFVD